MNDTNWCRNWALAECKDVSTVGTSEVHFFPFLIFCAHKTDCEALRAPERAVEGAVA